MKLTLERFRAILKQYPAFRYLVAYSGGLDSTVLLYLCWCLKEQGVLSELIAVHVNHGLHPDADQWNSRCEEVCQSLSVQCMTFQINVCTERGESLEEAARTARYQAFKSILLANDVLLTAHHRDDQTETVLLQLFRGAGIKGLGGMAESMPFGVAKLVRPLLPFSRQILCDFARENSLKWIDDSSNKDLGFDRNFVRHQIMPRLKKRWPAVDKTVARSARHIAEANCLLTGRAKQLLNLVLNRDCNTLEVGGLNSLDDADKRLVIRQWVDQLGFRAPSSVVLQRIINELINVAKDRNPQVCWGEVEVHRYRGELYLFGKQQEFDREQVMEWDGQEILNIPGNNGFLQTVPGSSMGIREKYWNCGVITARFRQGGETCRLIKRRGTRTLKNLFQEKSIPPWVRNRVPLIYIDGQLAAVADLWICEPFFGDCSNGNVALRWSGYDLGWKSGDSNRDVV